jgi:hypothetical protein
MTSKIPTIKQSCKGAWLIYVAISLGIATGLVLGQTLCKIFF